jgi:hypothetical protein
LPERIRGSAVWLPGGLAPGAWQNSPSVKKDFKKNKISQKNKISLDKLSKLLYYDLSVFQRKWGARLYAENPPLSRNCDWEEPLLTATGRELEDSCLGRSAGNCP